MRRWAVTSALLLSCSALLIAGDDVALRDTLRDHKFADGVLVASRSPGWFKNTNRDARRALNQGDVIVEVDGKTGWTRSTYLAYLMREKEPGSAVELKVLRNGKTVRVVFRIPTPRPEVQGH